MFFSACLQYHTMNPCQGGENWDPVLVADDLLEDKGRELGEGDGPVLCL